MPRVGFEPTIPVFEWGKAVISCVVRSEQHNRAVSLLALWA
jgi:hypothetical protein